MKTFGDNENRETRAARLNPTDLLGSRVTEINERVASMAMLAVSAHKPVVNGFAFAHTIGIGEAGGVHWLCKLRKGPWWYWGGSTVYDSGLEVNGLTRWQLYTLAARASPGIAIRPVVSLGVDENAVCRSADARHAEFGLTLMLRQAKMVGALPKQLRKQFKLALVATPGSAARPSFRC